MLKTHIDDYSDVMRTRQQLDPDSQIFTTGLPMI